MTKEHRFTAVYTIAIILLVIISTHLSWKYSLEGCYEDGGIYLAFGPKNTFVMMFDEKGDPIMQGRYTENSEQVQILFTEKYKEMIEGLPEYAEGYLNKTIDATHKNGTIIMPWATDYNSEWTLTKTKKYPQVVSPQHDQEAIPES